MLLRLSDFADGSSHQSVEDMGVLRSIRITILSPSDITSTKGAIKAMMEYEDLSIQGCQDRRFHGFILKI
ncbi:MAG: hypothetical protein ACLSFC_14480 [Enterocloster bolteae]